jgi:hypothetical protein
MWTAGYYITRVAASPTLLTSNESWTSSSHYSQRSAFTPQRPSAWCGICHQLAVVVKGNETPLHITLLKPSSETELRVTFYSDEPNVRHACRKITGTSYFDYCDPALRERVRWKCHMHCTIIHCATNLVVLSAPHSEIKCSRSWLSKPNTS